MKHPRKKPRERIKQARGTQGELVEEHSGSLLVVASWSYSQGCTCIVSCLCPSLLIP